MGTSQVFRRTLECAWKGLRYGRVLSSNYEIKKHSHVIGRLEAWSLNVTDNINLESHESHCKLSGVFLSTDTRVQYLLRVVERRGSHKME